MKPRGPLMIEHRLIEKMINIFSQKIPEFLLTSSVDPVLIDKLVDFIRIYADKTHHGKEEDILFNECVKKQMDFNDQAMMDELIADHVYGRQLTTELVEAKTRFLAGEDTFSIMLEKMQKLVTFYPRHIFKEDAIFFRDIEKYFSDDEHENMINQFWRFDRKMIHFKYKLVVDEILQQTLISQGAKVLTPRQ